jgi:GNAT superfamily N-acetyltransferase
MPDDITIRPMRPDEAAEVGRVTLAGYDASGGYIGGDYREWLAHPEERVDLATDVLVAVDPAGRILGTVTFVVAGDEEFEYGPHGDCGFRMLAVDPNAQQRGVGAALIDACIRNARERGCRRMVITSMTWMKIAHGIYARRGFVARPDLDVTFPPGVGHAFQLDLTDDAGAHFPPPGPVPDEPPWYEDAWTWLAHD